MSEAKTVLGGRKGGHPPLQSSIPPAVFLEEEREKKEGQGVRDNPLKAKPLAQVRADNRLLGSLSGKEEGGGEGGREGRGWRGGGIHTFLVSYFCPLLHIGEEKRGEGRKKKTSWKGGSRRPSSI